MTELGCDSTEQLKALLPRLEQELKDTVKFKDLYQFTFSFAKSPGQKGLACTELAVDTEENSSYLALCCGVRSSALVCCLQSGIGWL